MGNWQVQTTPKECDKNPEIPGKIKESQIMTIKENFEAFGKLIGSDSPKKIADAYEKMTAPDRDCCLNCQYYVGHCDCPYHIEGKLVAVMNTVTGAFRYAKNGKTYEVDWCVNHKMRVTK